MWQMWCMPWGSNPPPQICTQAEMSHCGSCRNSVGVKQRWCFSCNVKSNQRRKTEAKVFTDSGLVRFWIQDETNVRTKLIFCNASEKSGLQKLQFMSNSALLSEGGIYKTYFCDLWSLFLSFLLSRKQLDGGHFNESHLEGEKDQNTFMVHEAYHSVQYASTCCNTNLVTTQ